jgi:hypothetical protein
MFCSKLRGIHQSQHADIKTGLPTHRLSKFTVLVSRTWSYETQTDFILNVRSRESATIHLCNYRILFQRHDYIRFRRIHYKQLFTSLPPQSWLFQTTRTQLCGSALFIISLHIVTLKRIRPLPQKRVFSFHVSMAVQPFVGPWPLFNFLILYTFGKTPWTVDQSVARPLYLHNHRIHAHRHPCLKWDLNTWT